MAQFIGLVTLNAENFDSGAATDGQVLTADGSGGAAWEDATGGSGGGPDVQVFTTSGTWTKPANALWSTIVIVDGGNGGDAGYVIEGNPSPGNGGASSALYTIIETPSDFLGATEDVTVGAGGAGGTGGNSGSVGETSSFGIITNASVVSGFETIVRKSALPILAYGGNGGSPDSSGDTAQDVFGPFWDGESTQYSTNLTGGDGGEVGLAGVDGDSRRWTGRGGGGGGGGASDPAGNGGNGGAGGIGAGGGGGGAPGTAAMTGGNGGDGGDGVVIVFTHCGA